VLSLLKSDVLKDAAYIFLSPYHCSELIIGLAHRITVDFPHAVKWYREKIRGKDEKILGELKEIDEMIEKGDEYAFKMAIQRVKELLFDIGGENALERFKTILVVRDIRYRHGRTSPISALTCFIEKYQPLSFDKLPIKISEDILKNPPNHEKYHSLIDQIRPGLYWPNRIDAFTVALNIYLCNEAGRLGKKCYFPIYSTSYVFKDITWKNDPYAPRGGLSLQRDYISLLLYAYTLNVIAENEVIEELASGLRDLLTIVDKYKLPPVGSLDYIMPLKPILMRIASDLLNLREAEKTIEHIRPRHWFEERWLKSTIEVIKSCIIFIQEVKDVLEIEREALDILYRMLQRNVLAPFMTPDVLKDTMSRLKHFIEVMDVDREQRKGKGR